MNKQLPLEPPYPENIPGNIYRYWVVSPKRMLVRKSVMIPTEMKSAGSELVLRKILLPFQAVGQFPLIINGGRVKISSFLLFVGAAVLVILLASVEYVRRTIYANLEPVLIVINLLEYCPSILLLIVSLGWLPYRRAEAQQMLDSLTDVETSCKKKISNPDAAEYSRKMLLTLIMAVVLGANRWYFIIKLANPNVHSALCLHFTRTLLFLTVYGQFVGFCSVASSGFLVLETKLKEIKGIPGLESIARDYEKLAFASAALQKMYSPQILLLFAAIFVEINFSVYLSVVKPGHPDILRIAFAMWGLLYFWMGWCLVVAVDHIKNRADDFYAKYQAHIRRHGLHDYVPLNISGTEVKKSTTMTIFAALMSMVVPTLWTKVLYSTVSTGSQFFIWLIFCEYVPIILVLLISPAWLWWHLGTVNEMLRLMKYVESSCKHKLDLRDVSRYLGETYFAVLVIILGGSCRWFVVVSHAGFEKSTIHYAMACHVFRSILFCLVVGQFVGFCSLASSTFRLLKFKMKEIVGIPGLETIARDYEQVALAAQALQTIYSPQLLLIYSAVFVEVNFNLYLSFIVGYDSLYTITIAAWAGIFFWMSWWAISAVDRIKNQATLYIFALKRSKIEFSGCGIFTMDRKFLFSMCLATTTYVVMLKSLQ